MYSVNLANCHYQSVAQGGGGEGRLPGWRSGHLCHDHVKSLREMRTAEANVFPLHLKGYICHGGDGKAADEGRET